MTPGHPERGVTPGVEATTGPLGQGFGNGVGMAMAEAYLAAAYNRPGFEIVDHFTYGIVSDGDLMEGVSSEAASLAGHLKLGKLIYLYDDNHVTLSAGNRHHLHRGSRTPLRGVRLAHSVGRRRQRPGGGRRRAARRRRGETDRPSLILVRTHIGYGSPHKQDTFEAHGSPLGRRRGAADEREPGLADPNRRSMSQSAALEHFREAVEQGQQAEDGVARPSLSVTRERIPISRSGLATGHARRVARGLGRRDLPVFPAEPKGMATRVAAGKVMNAIAPDCPR